MVEANPTPIMENPPSLSSGEAAFSGNNDSAAKVGAQEIQEVEVSNRDVNQMNQGGENGTEGATDEVVNMVEADDANKDDFSCANLVGTADANKDAEYDDNIESVDVEIAGKEYACQKEDKEEKYEHGQDVKEAEGEGINLVEAKTDAGNEEVKENVEREEKLDKIEEKQSNTIIQVEDEEMVHKKGTSLKINKDTMCKNTQDAIAAEGEGDEMVEAQNDAGSEEAKENKKEETEVMIADKMNETNIHDEEEKMACKEYACQKNDKEGMCANDQDEMAAEGKDTNMVEEKSVAREAEVVESEKEDKEGNTKEKKSKANIQDEDEKMDDEEDAYQKEDREAMSEDANVAMVEEYMNIKLNEITIVAIETELKENVKEEVEDKAKEDSNIQAEDVKRVGACQKEDNENQNEDSHDTNEAEGEEIKLLVEAKTIAQNAVVQENTNEANEDRPVENTSNPDAINYGAKEIRNKEEIEDTTHKKQKDNNEETICIEKQVKERMDLMEKDTKELGNGEEICAEKQEGSEGRIVDVVDKQEMSEREQRALEKQEGLKGEVKDGMDKQELNDREQSVVDKEETGSVDNQEVHDIEQNVEKLFVEFTEEEKYGASKHEELKHEQNEASEKQEEVRQQDGGSSAKKREEEQLDGKGTVENKKDKNYDGKVGTEIKELRKEEAIEKKEEDKVGEKGASEKDEKMETHKESTAENVRNDAQIDDIYMEKGQNKGTKRSVAERDGTENGSAFDKEEDSDAEVDQDDESHKNIVENTEEVSKRKKAKTDGEKDHGKHGKQDGSKSREVGNLSSSSLHCLDRPVRVRRTVQRFVDLFEESGSNFVVDKGYGTPLKNITSVAERIKTKKSSELKFLHQLLFGRRGKAADFQSHILQFSGFVWHGSDEKQRAKVTEKLNNCSIDTLLDLCDLLAFSTVSKANSRKGDIVAKLLDFFAKPRAMDDTLYDGQEYNSRKRKRGGEIETKELEGAQKRSIKRLHDENKSNKKYSESESSDEGHEEDECMNSDNKENKSYDEAEDDYNSIKVNASELSSDKRMPIKGSVPKSIPFTTGSRKVSSSSKCSKHEQSYNEDAKVFSGKSKSTTPKHSIQIEKEIREKNLSGLMVKKNKGKSAEARKSFPRKDDLQKTIIRLLKNVDFDTTTFGDILENLDEHYKMDLSSRKDDIKLMIEEEISKLATKASVKRR